MWRKAVPPFFALLGFFLSAASGSAITLDPQPGFNEYNAEAAVHPNGGVLLVWTRNQPDVPVVTAMAATLDPDTGQLGELHEWGAGSVDHVLPLGAGYLALRVDGQLFAQVLDEDGRPVGVAQLLGGAGFPAAAHSTSDGGAIVVTILLIPGTDPESVVNAWRFGPDGTVLSGPAEVARNAIQADLDADAAGNLVMAWRAWGNSVFAQRFSPDLRPLSRILPVSAGPAYAVSVAAAPDGRFVVIYSKRAALWTRAFRANGSSAGKSSLIAPQGRQRGRVLFEMEAAAGAEGRILAAWLGNTAVPTMQARVLSQAGLPLTRIFRLEPARSDLSVLQEPRVLRLPEGDFLVLWTGTGEDGTARMAFRRVSGR
jgi:hypothetical protein